MTTDILDKNLYHQPYLLERIESAIKNSGKSLENITSEDLAQLDEFHIGGRIATQHLIEQLNFQPADTLLDIGCGLGGASRFVAINYGNSVTGIDATEDFVLTGNMINQWLNINHLVNLIHGDASKLVFKNGTYDGGFMLHVGMNIKQKETLFRQISRVLKPGSMFGIYDVMRTGKGNLAYPVPWAMKEQYSFLDSLENYITALESVGFKILDINNRKNFALAFFKKQKEKQEKGNLHQKIGLHLLMKEAASIKGRNLVKNIHANLISPFEIIVMKN